MMSLFSIIKSSQWRGLIEFVVRIPFTTLRFLAGLFDLPHLCPHVISGIFIPSYHQVGRTKWDKLHNALGTDRCSMNMRSLPLPLMPAAGRPHSTKKEAMFFFQTAGNPGSQLLQTMLTYFCHSWCVYNVPCQLSSWADFMTTESLTCFPLLLLILWFQIEVKWQFHNVLHISQTWRTCFIVS